MAKKYLITGAAGRVGSRVTKHLISAGFDMHATDLRFAMDREFPVTIADLLNPLDCYKLVENVDAVIHFGNHPNIGRGPAQRVYSENLTMNMNLLRATVEAGIREFYFTSSIQAFGPLDPFAEVRASTLPLSEETPAFPDNEYGLSKLATEQMLAFFLRTHGLNSVSLRMPYMSDDESAMWSAYFKKPRNRLHRSSNLDRHLHLDISDLGRLIEMTLPKALTGAHVWFPVSLNSKDGTSLRDAMLQIEVFADLIKTCNQVVDISTITEATGWTPLV